MNFKQLLTRLFNNFFRNTTKIETHEIDNPKKFMETHSDRMTPYIKTKMYDSALVLIDEMAKFDANAQQRKHIVYLAIENDVICGFQYFYYLPKNSYSNLFGVYVDPDFRGRSLADRLIKKAVVELIRLGKTEIEVFLAKNTDNSGPEYYLEEYLEKLKETYPNVKFDIKKGQ